ncbi:hypothetical protein CPB84DRAFT_1769943 [Gymnopilus junonius]|uniref:PHD-type domain-containing protein n=1 Tax=Gymnopilus junonius TaxID=109634 RepID=A0A9P5TQ16_GYMJU|nr:hypothetical protein CPB84DRAFT_1769943 [Gymnopilus junonius]
MVQCETCKVWQHGLCMGYQSEDQVHDDDYYCELCRPELHIELLKKLAKKPRQTSATSKQDTSSNPRISRSHSPAHILKQPSKRRNTMNSRDAAFDESLKEIIEATAAEAAAVQETSVDHANVIQPDASETSKKKRKRTDDDANFKKRTRSASTASDRQSGVVPIVDPTPIERPAPPVPKPSAGRNKRGGRKVITAETVDSEEAPGSATKRAGNNPRSKNGAANKRPALAQSTSHGSGANGHEHGTRRNQSAGGQQTGTSAADARAYRNTHAYAVSQQSLFTSWNLPDYLSHLEPMLPTQTPQPLEVRAGGVGIAPGSRGGSLERTMERGVKVRWPAKRMSVGDMNKRVRALVEWVGREQVSLEDRKRRREALETVLREQAIASTEPPVATGSDVLMVLDDTHHGSTAAATVTTSTTTRQHIGPHLMSASALEMSAQTMKMMEELMEELIGFQEKFGPGAKGRDRERRLATS